MVASGAIVRRKYDFAYSDGAWEFTGVSGEIERMTSEAMSDACYDVLGEGEDVFADTMRDPAVSP